MILDVNTMKVLKNFATIQPNILLPNGNNLTTISSTNNIVGSTVLIQPFGGGNFPTAGAGIYNLDELLGVISFMTYDTALPVLTFEDNFVTIATGTTNPGGVAVTPSRSVKYYYADPSILKTYTGNIVFPTTNVQFDLSEGVLQSIRSAASALGHVKMVITPSGNNDVKITVVDSSDSTSNSFELEVARTDGGSSTTFNLVMNIGNLKLVTPPDPDSGTIGRYKVEIASQAAGIISKFTILESDGTTFNSTFYYVALEATSTYGP